MERHYIDGVVSVITPVYNAEKYLENAIKSVLAQSYKEIEIVLVDDCSEDGSSQIIAGYRQSHPEITYFRQPQNMGAGAARNKALELAAGQYVAFLDSDDVWKLDKIEKQIKRMKEAKSPFSYTAIEMIDAKGNRIKGKRNIRESCDYTYLLHNTMIATSSVIIDRRISGDFRMPLRRGGQDYATWLMLLRGGNLACGINEALVSYRVREHSLSSNKFKSLKQVWEIQTQDEGIGKFKAAFHLGCFVFHGVKKYFL